jgi:hypothetical protein
MTSPTEKCIEFTCINAGNNFYICEDNYWTLTSNFIFDGKLPTATLKSHWFRLEKEPQKVERKIIKVLKNEYVLKDKNLSGTYPDVLEWEAFADEDSEWYRYEKLYDHVYEIEDVLEEVEFKLKIYSVDSEYQFITQQKYTTSVSLVTELEVPEPLYTEYPNFITGEALYKIVREHIKNNINPVNARITSDYDFCFTVKKVVKLDKEKAYKVDVSRINSKRPKYEVRYKKEELATCFEMAPKAYNEYPVLKGMTASNYLKLEKKINDYLDDLMVKINTPVRECSHCSGLGVIIDEHASN